MSEEKTFFKLISKHWSKSASSIASKASVQKNFRVITRIFVNGPPNRTYFPTYSPHKTSVSLLDHPTPCKVCFPSPWHSCWSSVWPWLPVHFQVWKQFCFALNAKVSLRLPPRVQRSAEHINQELKSTLRCLTSTNPSDWSKFLQYTHNSL